MSCIPNDVRDEVSSAKLTNKSSGLSARADATSTVSLTRVWSHTATSFVALLRWLDRASPARFMLALLITTHTGLLAYSGYVHSPTIDEPAHLVAGLSHWRFGRFDLYRVNPPLVRMIAVLPVLALGYEEEWSGFDYAPGARPEFAIGEQFVALNRERTFLLTMVARWACIPFSWVGLLVCYLWARDLYGRAAGILSATLWCFEPNILGHTSLITPDAHATSLGAAACYTFWRWLRNPTWGQAILTGVVLGLAELAKTTLIVLYPLWPLMWIIYRWRQRSTMNRRNWLREAAMLMLRMAIGLYVLNLGYGLEKPLTPLGKLHFVSELFAGAHNRKTAQQGETQDTAWLATRPSHLKVNPHNRFAGSWLAHLPVPFPKNYILGIDVQQRDFENYGRPSYLRGDWKKQGWWYYYLYSALIKVPLGLWIIAVASLLSMSLGHSAGSRDELVLLFPAVMVFAVVSSKYGFSEHFRYVLPAFPFLFIYCSRLFSTRLRAACKLIVRDHYYHFAERLLWPIIAFLVIWTVTSSLWIFPHSLAYFNESICGPLNGPRYLLGSNVDWGQDLRYVIWKFEKIDKSKARHLAYHGYFDPGDVGLGYTLPLKSARNHSSMARLLPGYYAVSINVLHAYPWPARDGAEAPPALCSRQTLDALPASQIQSRAGYSMLVYKVLEDEDSAIDDMLTPPSVH